MTDAELWRSWTIWIGVASVVIAIAAGLLILILVTARRILTDSVRALNAAEAIRRQTAAIWQLELTNDVTAEIRAIVREIDAKSGALVDALEHHASPASASRRKP